MFLPNRKWWEWIHLFVILFLASFNYQIQAEFPGGFIFSSLSPDDFTWSTPLLDLGPTPDPDPQKCAEKTGSVEFDLPGCGCCGGCGCNVTCKDCGRPGGIFYPGEVEYPEMGESSRHGDKRRMIPPQRPEVCKPRQSCCSGKVRVTTWFVPGNCYTRFKEGPSTKIIKMDPDGNFGLIRERGVIFNDGTTWRVVFKDSIDYFSTTPSSLQF